MTPKERLAEAVLKAAGSSLKHYSLPGTREAILLAAANGILEEREACAKVAENGRFLSEDSLEAQFGKAVAAAIRRRT